MKALLIDDNKEISEMLYQYLTLKGKYDCTVSNSGKDGLKQIQTKKYDFVILDLAMPEFTGFDIIESLHKTGDLKKQKIFVLTASSISDVEIKDLLEKGVRACIKKPVDL